MNEAIKISVFSHIDDSVAVMSSIASMGAFHPEKTDRLKNDIIFENMEILADLLVKIENARGELEPYFSGNVKSSKTIPFSELIETSNNILKTFSEKILPSLQRIRNVEMKKLTIKEDLKMISNINKNTNFGPINETKSSFLSGKMPSKAVKHFQLMLSERLPDSVVVFGPWEGGWDYVLIGTSDDVQLESLLSEFTWIPLYLPKIRGTVAEFKDSLLKENQDLDRELSVLHSSVLKFALKFYPNLLTSKEMLNNYYKVLGISKYAKKSDFFILIEGWVLKKRFSRFKNTLTKIEGVEIFKEKFNPNDAPTLPDHPKAVDPFYSIVSLMGPSSQGSIDPTLSVSFFFPFFFGMMLGDVGYGCAILFLTILFRKQVDKLFDLLLGSYFSSFSWVLIVSGFSSVIFGFLFGEVFGVSITPVLFNRFENIEALLVSSFIIGLIHLNLGFLIKLIGDIKKGALTIITNLSWISLQIGIFGMFFNFTAGLLIATASAVLLLRNGGLSSLFVMFSLFGNMFSYLRLAAIGLSSFGIALVVNQLAAMSGSAKILILVFGHTLTLVIGIFAPFIQAMRLHLIEFFSKFYEVGKRVFNPLSLTHEHTGGDLIW
ncbi:MAG: hypothetical protein GOV01_03725 [Candidatus Altiarchaeota archaeon]|nr:hypothetical protein [Candidatus Altiarchaeota archaeon]